MEMISFAKAYLKAERELRKECDEMVINGDLSEATVKVNHLAKMQQNNEKVISQLSQKIDELQKTGCGCNKE